MTIDNVDIEMKAKEEKGQEKAKSFYEASPL